MRRASRLIGLSMGEQHAFPGFAGPVLAQHIADFGQYQSGQSSEDAIHFVAGNSQ